MVNAYPLFSLVLFVDGNSLSILNHSETDLIKPKQVEALACKTHQQVLAFLLTLQGSDLVDKFQFYHDDNMRYEGHLSAGFPTTEIHECPLQVQIAFVQRKIKESIDGIPANERYACVIQ